MDRRAFLQTVAGAGLLRNAFAAQRRPNILIILADDMGYHDTGFNGCTDFATPNIDSIAKAGIRFTDGYVSHPFCSPTRSGLMTGRYQQRYGHENNPKYDPHDEISGLPTTEIALPQVIADAGYVTGQIGKWHLGAAPKFHPLKRGYQEQFGFIGGGHDYFKAEMTGDPKEYFIPIQRNGKPVEEQEYLTDAFSREAVSFIKRHAKDPFFLYLAYNCPHTPQQVSQKYLDLFANVPDRQRRLYAAMNTAMDDGVGRVLATLREEKLDSDTLVFFLSDNGGPIGVNGSSNAPLRGGKGQVYDGGIRIPFAARWTGHLPAGKVLHDPVISLDLLPTAVKLAGGQLPRDRKIDGVDLMPYLSGKSAKLPHEKLFWRTGGGASYAVREGRYKLVKIGNRTELFDLESDIGETHDLSAEKPDVLKRLDDARVEWNKELIPPIFQSPGPDNPKAKAKKKQ
jgi:arylsulfatase A-like enzyme